eukprot:364181-Chlamydomonas_euryale.AAC.1
MTASVAASATVTAYDWQLGKNIEPDIIKQSKLGLSLDNSAICNDCDLAAEDLKVLRQESQCNSNTYSNTICNTFGHRNVHSKINDKSGAHMQVCAALRLNIALHEAWAARTATSAAPIEVLEY